MTMNPATTRPSLPRTRRTGSVHACCCALGLLLAGTAASARAASPVPQLLNFQGRVTVNAAPFSGTGRLKFALVDAAGTTSYWSNDGSSVNGSEPSAFVPLPVSKGLYSVLLGDTSLAGMTLPVDPVALGANPVFLRVWFDDGINGSLRLVPDQQIASVAFALWAGTIADGAVTAAKLAPGALQAGALVGTLDPARLPANVALKTPDLQSTSNALSAQIIALQGQIAALTTQVALLGGSGALRVSPLAADPALAGAGWLALGSFPEAPWRDSVAEGAPSGRWAHATAWLPASSQMFVWGGALAADLLSCAGALYSSAGDQWRSLPTVDAPTPRRGHTVVSDGLGAVVWGGLSEGGRLNTGARFDSATFSWKPTATLDAPSARDGHVAAWIPPFMVIWGGRRSTGPVGDGAVYNVATGQWTPLALPNAPVPRHGATAVTTADRMIVWGGHGLQGDLNTGGQLVFKTSPTPAPLEWKAVSALNAPAARSDHGAVMAGGRMIVWGGRNGSTPLGDGGSYDPANDTWQPLPTASAPSPRYGHTVLWTGQELLVLGGQTAAGPTNDGAAYDPQANRWRPLTLAGNPVARADAAAVWTGTEALVFGGRNGQAALAALQRLNPQPPWFLYRKP